MPKNLLSIITERLVCSSKEAKRVIDQRRVLVNKKIETIASRTINSADLVEIIDQEMVGLSSAAVLYICQNFVVVNKMAGILSNGPDSLQEALKQFLKVEELYAVHRLDRYTTGCNIFAFNSRTFDVFTAAFAERKITKTYRALVLGRLARKTIEIRQPIDGKEALSRVKVLAASKAISFLEIDLMTGRTHQARKHLLSIGHPILGDREYGRFPQELRTITRQMLHAYQLQIPMLGVGKAVNVKAPLPDDFKALVAKVKLPLFEQ